MSGIISRDGVRRWITVRARKLASMRTHVCQDDFWDRRRITTCSAHDSVRTRLFVHYISPRGDVLSISNLGFEGFSLRLSGPALYHNHLPTESEMDIFHSSLTYRHLQADTSAADLDSHVVSTQTADKPLAGKIPLKRCRKGTRSALFICPGSPPQRRTAINSIAIGGLIPVIFKLLSCWKVRSSPTRSTRSFSSLPRIRTSVRYGETSHESCSSGPRRNMHLSLTPPKQATSYSPIAKAPSSCQ